MTMIVIGHLGEATRREIDLRCGTDTAGLLERLVRRGLLELRTDRCGLSLAPNGTEAWP